MRSLGYCVSALLIVGAVCATFYTPERRWIEGEKVGDRVAQAPFAAALPECLKQDDPSGLAAFNRTGTYQVSGWLVSPTRTDKVVGCMSAKGWLLVPTHLYTP